MDDGLAISVRDVSKRFRLFGSPKERLLEALHPFKKQYHRDFWALRNISFDVPRGSTLGIIGRNGSGKSTLLQIICSILRPTGGSVSVDGRISALLELGAGFNPEFTGRENVLFAGRLNGLPEAEVKRRLPEIEAFADIGQFIDQPVKTYSSGMFVRLAFASAINVDPDILIIDEALAVGDAKFQNKCYQKFIQFQQSGKTIVFVTHDTSAVVRHCRQALLLEGGTLLDAGKPNDVVNHYYEILQMENTPVVPVPPPGANGAVAVGAAAGAPADGADAELERFLRQTPPGDGCTLRRSYNKNERRFGDRRAEVVDYLVVCGQEHDPVAVESGQSVDFFIKFRCHQDVPAPTFGFGVKTTDGVTIYASNSRYRRQEVRPFRKAEVVVFKATMRLDLKAGDYFFSLGVADWREGDYAMVDSRHDLVHLTVRERESFDGLVNLQTEFQEFQRGSCHGS